MTELKYPIGIETFPELIEENYVYIDKTRFIHSLVSTGKYYFLSRPRRFGKSLLLSTIKSYFEGRRDLFEGLEISRHEHQWESHPVFHLNFVNANTSTIEGLQSILNAHLSRWERVYGEETTASDFAQRFYGVLERAVMATGRKAVVLIDEYDKYLVAAMDCPELNDTFRSVLKPLYSTLKAADSYICFGMITGVTRFSRLSIFSDLNNLEDITMDSRYSSICGITEEEMLHYLSGGIDAMAKKMRISRTDTLKALKENYDGYHFAYPSPDIYNPYSLLCALKKEGIGAYWFQTGTPTFLFEAMRNRGGDIASLFKTCAQERVLSEIDSWQNNPVALLFQTGYLTINGYDGESMEYRLKVPNGEVRRGLFEGLLPVFSGRDNVISSNFITNLTEAVRNGQAEIFLQLLKSFLADIPYDLSKNKPEIYFENNIYIIFKLLGLNVHTEYRTSYGRIDIVVFTDSYIYVMELKLNGSAKAALAQIDSKDYLLPFSSAGRRLFKIGLNFSKRTRNLTRPLIEG